MGYKPVPTCIHRGREFTCNAPEFGDFKLLGFKLGQRKCILIDPASKGECDWLESLPVKPPPGPPSKKDSAKITAVEITSETVVPNGTYNCHHDPCHMQKTEQHTYSCKHCGCEITNSNKPNRGVSKPLPKPTMM